VSPEISATNPASVRNSENSETSIRSMRDSPVVEYDEPPAAKLLSVGNRFVRNVNRNVGPAVFAYSEHDGRTMVVAADRRSSAARPARDAWHAAIPVARRRQRCGARADAFDPSRPRIR